MSAINLKDTAGVMYFYHPYSITPWNFNLPWRWNNRKQTQSACKITSWTSQKIQQNSLTTVMKDKLFAALSVSRKWAKINLLTETFSGKIPQLNCFCYSLLIAQSKHPSSSPFSSHYTVNASKTPLS